MVRPSIAVFSRLTALWVWHLRLSSLNATPVFETLAEQNKPLKSVFGLSLSKSNPELVLGGTAQDQFKGKLAYSPVIKEAGEVPVRISRCVSWLYSNTDTMQAFWQISFGDIKVDGKPIPHTVTNAVFDSGASQIIGEPGTVVSIYENIPGSGILAGSDGIYTGTFVTELIIGVANCFTRK
jgi:Eukaryotic aspartyl protease